MVALVALLVCCMIPMTVVSFATNTLTISASGNSISSVDPAAEFTEITPYQSTPGGEASVSGVSEASGPTILAANDSEASTVSESSTAVEIGSASTTSSTLPDPTTTGGDDLGNPSNLPQTGSPFENTVLMLVTGFCLVTVGILVFGKRKKDQH